jgi:hypothetical protein
LFRWHKSLLGLGASFPRFTLGTENETPAPVWFLAGAAMFAAEAAAGPARRESPCNFLHFAGTRGAIRRSLP